MYNYFLLKHLLNNINNQSFKCLFISMENNLSDQEIFFQELSNKIKEKLYHFL